jgi:hypothetical protein
MHKHIILADSTDGAGRQYVTSSRYGHLSNNLLDAALFASEDAAKSSVRELLTKDFERTNHVTLLLGTVEFTVTSVNPVPRKPAAKGFVIRRNKGDYYKGPKTKPPRDFMDAYYHYVANRDAATVFPSMAIAMAYGDAIREILRETAERDARSSNPSASYQQLYDEFSFLVEEI